MNIIIKYSKWTGKHKKRETGAKHKKLNKSIFKVDYTNNKKFIKN